MSKKISPLSWSLMSSGDDDGLGRRALPFHPGLRLVQEDNGRLLDTPFPTRLGLRLSEHGNRDLAWSLSWNLMSSLR